MKEEEKKDVHYVCFDCGNPFKTEKSNNIVTCFHSICDLCGENKPVTHIRNFNYLKPIQK